jgi:hypothetical protein
MKKPLAAIVLGLLFSGNVYAERITMNELLENKYTIKKQEMIKFEKRALKIFTLEKSRKIMICTVQIDLYGINSSSRCMAP